jgi:transposase-like protein
VTGDDRVACAACGSTDARKHGRDRQGRQLYRCSACRCRFTVLTGTPFSGYRFPPEIIGLAVRWYVRYRLSYADVAELLAERGVTVDPSTIYAWVREFSPLYEEAARPFRHGSGARGAWTRPLSKSWGSGRKCTVRLMDKGRSSTST